MNPQLICSQRQWLHSSVGRASHRYREVTGSNPVEVLNFFEISFRNCINCVHCDDLFFTFTITFHKYLWCSRFFEFHSKNSLFLTFDYCRYNIKPFSSGENCETLEDQFCFIVSFTIVELRFTERDY